MPIRQAPIQGYSGITSLEVPRGGDDRQGQRREDEGQLQKCSSAFGGSREAGQAAAGPGGRGGEMLEQTAVTHRIMLLVLSLVDRTSSMLLLPETPGQCLPAERWQRRAVFAAMNSAPIPSASRLREPGSGTVAIV